MAATGSSTATSSPNNVAEELSQSELVLEKKLSPEAQLERQKIMQEILICEEEYLRNLDILVSNYLETFVADQHGGRKVMTLFTNIREMKIVQTSIVKSLQDPCSGFTLIHQFATVLLNSSQTLKTLYSQYSLMYRDNISLLCSKRSYNPEFAEYINSRRDLAEGKDLAWLLQSPAQKIVQYLYFVELLLEHSLSPSSLEHTALSATYNRMKYLCEMSDLSLRTLEEKSNWNENITKSADLRLSESKPKSIQNMGQEYEGWNVLVTGDVKGRRKTEFIHSFVSQVTKSSVQMHISNYVVPLVLEPPYSMANQEVYLRIWDSSGFEKFKHLRSLNYPLMDVIILLFHRSSIEDFNEIVPKWYRELKYQVPTLPFLLVGLGKDEEAEVTLQQANSLAALLGTRYIQCESVQEIGNAFKEAASAVVYPSRYMSFRDSTVEGDEATEKILENILKSRLDLSYQGLGMRSQLPKELKFCSNLTDLDLSWNMLERLPLELIELTTLTRLNLSHNKLTDVNGLEQWTQLTDVNLQHNQLNFLPAGLGHCMNLMVLNITENPLDTLPKDIFPKKSFNEYKNHGSRNQLYAYLRSIQEGGQAPHYRVKVMFVGDGEVGKTSLLNCFQELQFNNMDKRRRRSSSVISVKTKVGVNIADPPPITDGIEISEVIWYDKEKEKDVVWDCWDYAGQDIYYTTHQFFLSAGAVYLVIFNLLNRDLSRVEYWLNSVHTRARGSPIILVGTHADHPLCTPEYIADYERDLKKRYMKRFKSKLGVPSIKALYTLSCKPTKKGMPQEKVSVLMERISLITTKYRLVGLLYPKSWIGLEKHLRALSSQRDSEPLMDWASFKEIAKNCHISDDDVGEAASFLHSSGVICHFNDARSGLSDLVILDPQFLTNVMSAVISLRQNFIDNGEILEQNLVHIWRAFDPKLHHALMSLLERFEIAFELPSTSSGARYLIPSLLQENQPATYQQLWPTLDPATHYQLGRVYHFKFMPLGFFSRLFVRTLHLPGVESMAYWRNGVIISYHSSDKAILRYNPTEYKLSILVRGLRIGRMRGQLLRLLVENVQTVIEGWYETEVDITIPCSHCIEAGSYDPHHFKLEDCIEKVTSGSGHPYMLCHGVRRVRVDVLAPDVSFADMRTKRINFEDLTIVRVLGVGAFGKVYEVIYKNRNLAVKVLEKATDDHEYSKQIEDDDEAYQRFNEFQREVWIMSCLKHKNLVQLAGLCTNPPAMVMEILRFGDLYHILYPKKPKELQNDREAGREEEEEEAGDEPDELSTIANKWASIQSWHSQLKNSLYLRLKIALDIAKGMRYLHSMNPPIIHRDLRSPNIFLTSLSEDPTQTNAKVGDFGLSRLVTTTLAGGDFNLNWLAPEVMEEKPYTEKMDVYSFGIICCELISLSPPFEEYDTRFGGRPRHVFIQAVVQGLRPTIPEDCPKEFAEVITGCWDGDERNRPTFNDIVLQIVSCMHNLGMVAEAEENDEDEDEIPSTPETSDQPTLHAPTPDPQESSQVIEMETRLEPKHPHSVQCLLQVNNTVWAGCRNGVVRIWDIESGEFLEDFMANTNMKGLLSMQVICGSYVWISSEDGAITAFEISASNKENKPHRICRPGKKEVKPGIRSLLQLHKLSDMDPKVKTIRVYSGDIEGQICMWKVKKRSPGKKFTQEKVHLFEKNCVECMHQDNERIWVGLRGEIAVLDTNSTRIVAVWKAHRGPVNSLVTFGRYIWSGGHDGSICIWDTEKLAAYHESKDIAPEKKITSHTSKVYALVKCGNYIVSGSFDMSVIAYDGKTWEVLQEEKAHKDGIRSMVSVNDNCFWTGSMQRDATICCWRISKDHN